MFPDDSYLFSVVYASFVMPNYTTPFGVFAGPNLPTPALDADDVTSLKYAPAKGQQGDFKTSFRLLKTTAWPPMSGKDNGTASTDSSMDVLNPLPHDHVCFPGPLGKANRLDNTCLGTSDNACFQKVYDPEIMNLLNILDMPACHSKKNNNNGLCIHLSISLL